MNLTVDYSGDQMFMVPAGNIEESIAEEMKQRFYENDVSKIKRLVIDFSGVSFIGSVGIGSLLLFHKTLSYQDAQLELVNLPNEILELFTMLKLDSLFGLKCGHTDCGAY